MLSEKTKETLRRDGEDTKELVTTIAAIAAYMEEKDLLDDYVAWVEKNKDELREILFR